MVLIFCPFASTSFSNKISFSKDDQFFQYCFAKVPYIIYQHNLFLYTKVTM